MHRVKNDTEQYTKVALSTHQLLDVRELTKAMYALPKWRMARSLWPDVVTYVVGVMDDRPELYGGILA
jgi:DNA gyrase inhibitor GyrI